MPTDPNQRAWLTIQMAAGEAEPEPERPAKDPASVELGRRGGLIGGPRRAAKLTRERRIEIARKAARTRWDQRSSPEQTD